MSKIQRVLTGVAFGMVALITACIGPVHAAGWCGNYARHHLVSRDPGKTYNLACKWLDYGNPALPGPNVMVVWCNRGHHHVGKIVGQCNGYMCPVLSGNDGHAVRTRMRSVADASFRAL